MESQQKPYAEDDIIRASLLMTDAMLATVPPKSKVVDSLGHRKVMLTDDAGALLQAEPLVQGYHMVLELTGKELGMWLLEFGHPFWLWNPQTEKFQQMRVVVSEDDNEDT